MKRLTLLFTIIFCFFNVQSVAAISAQSAVLLDAKTGRILFEKDAFTKRSMASTTKIMTAILAIENGNESDIVTVSQKAASQEGSSMYLAAGQKVSLGELIGGLMMASGNDAAVAIAEHISKDTKSFAKLMTEKAMQIGAQNTSFKNPNGLDEEGHFSTAYDMALIARYCMQNPRFAEIVSKSKIDAIGNTYYNHNKLLYKYPYTTGIKTGFTKKSGRCLVSSAEKDGFSLIAVTLSAPDDWNDHIYLFNYGFDNFKKRDIIKKEVVKEIWVSEGEKEKVSVSYSEDASLYLAENENVEVVVNCPDSVLAPVLKGQVIGNATINKDGQTLKSVDIIADEDVEKKASNLLLENFTKIIIIWLRQSAG